MNKLTTLFLHCAKHLITPYHLIIRTTHVGTTIHLMLQMSKMKDREGKSLYPIQSPWVAEVKYKLRKFYSRAHYTTKLCENHLLNVGLISQLVGETENEDIVRWVAYLDKRISVGTHRKGNTSRIRVSGKVFWRSWGQIWVLKNKWELTGKGHGRALQATRAPCMLCTAGGVWEPWDKRPERNQGPWVLRLELVWTFHLKVMEAIDWF